MATKKKDYSAIKTGSVYDTLEEVTAEPIPQQIPVREKGTLPTDEEIRLAREQSRTRGRKGVKMLRINMAFTPETHDYIKTMAQISGLTITQFTELVFKRSREENAALYEQAKAFRQNLK